MLNKIDGWIWMNGEFIRWEDARCHILAHTLHYGSGVFEGERAYNGQIFKMTEHHQRLHDSAGMLDFEIPYSVEELNQAAQEVLTRNGLNDAYIRPVAWHGAEQLNVDSTKNTVNVAIAAWEWTSYFDAKSQGLTLMWSEWVRPAANMSPVKAKANGQYIIGTLSKNKAVASGYHDALMLDYRGYIAECSGANIFFVQDGVVYTPIADCFLDGITRQTVIALLKASGIPVVEKHLKPSDITMVDEIFITGTAVEIQPITQIGTQKYPIGPVTINIIETYKQLVQGSARADNII